MEIVKKARGCEDLLFEDTRKWKIVEKILHDISKKYNFLELRTPIFESTNLFVRGIGDTTDVVSKEMYTFEDRKNRSLTLRPEGTAGAMRAYIENKMFGYDNQPVKAYYLGPMFRYERPQKGRQRQFHQFGVEVIGLKSPQIDVETILLGLDICNNLGLKNIKVLINTLGDSESRLRYHDALIMYFSNYKSDLCQDCQSRLNKNPLRILDCKIDGNKDFVVNSPKLKDFLNEDSKQYFDTVLNILDALYISYEIDDHLVRGLDYYTDTIFEVVSLNKESGAQATLFGGGRYDGLSKELGGPDVSGIGFGMGIERMMISVNIENPSLFEKKPLDVFIIPLNKNLKSYAFSVLKKIRDLDLISDMEYSNKSIKAMYKYCERNNIKNVLIIGEGDVEYETVIFKNIETAEQITLKLSELELIKERINRQNENLQK